MLSSVPLSVRIESQMNFVGTSSHHLLLFFWHYGENWVLKDFFFPFSIFNYGKLWIWKSSTLAKAAAFLTGLRGFIDWFWQNSFVPKSRYGLQYSLRAFLEPATTTRRLEWDVNGLQSALKGTLLRDDAPGISVRKFVDTNIVAPGTRHWQLILSPKGQRIFEQFFTTCPWLQTIHVSYLVLCRSCRRLFPFDRKLTSGLLAQVLVHFCQLNPIVWRF